MAAARVVGNRRFETQLARILDVRLGEGTHELRRIARAKMNIPYPPASRPGDSPHRRSGGARRAIFAKRVRPMEWAFGYRRVAPNPERPGTDRSLLGLWLELGTGRHRRSLPAGANSVLPSAGGSGFNTAATGRHTSMHARPVLLPTLMQDGPRVFETALQKGATVRARLGGR